MNSNDEPNEDFYRFSMFDQREPTEREKELIRKQQKLENAKLDAEIAEQEARIKKARAEVADSARANGDGSDSPHCLSREELEKAYSELKAENGWLKTQIEQLRAPVIRLPWPQAMWQLGEFIIKQSKLNPDDDYLVEETIKREAGKYNNKKGEQIEGANCLRCYREKHPRKSPRKSR